MARSLESMVVFDYDCQDGSILFEHSTKNQTQAALSMRMCVYAWGEDLSLKAIIWWEESCKKKTKPANG